MKYVISLLLMVTALGFTMTTHADVNFGSAMNVINLHPNSSVTTSGDSTAVDMLLYDGQCAGIIDSHTVSGDNSTLALKLTHSVSNDSSFGDVSGGGFTALASSDSSQKIVFNKNNLKRYVRLNRVIGGTAVPTYLLSGKLLCKKKYR